MGDLVLAELNQRIGLPRMSIEVRRCAIPVAAHRRCVNKIISGVRGADSFLFVFWGYRRNGSVPFCTIYFAENSSAMPHVFSPTSICAMIQLAESRMQSHESVRIAKFACDW